MSCSENANTDAILTYIVSISNICDLAPFSNLNEPITCSDLRNSVKIARLPDWSPNKLRIIAP